MTFGRSIEMLQSSSEIGLDIISHVSISPRQTQQKYF